MLTTGIGRKPLTLKPLVDPKYNPNDPLEEPLIDGALNPKPKEDILS